MPPGPLRFPNRSWSTTGTGQGLVWALPGEPFSRYLLQDVTPPPGGVRGEPEDKAMQRSPGQELEGENLGLAGPDFRPVQLKHSN